MDMVKTTIILEDRLYKELVDESIDKYGSTKKLSRLISKLPTAKACGAFHKLMKHVAQQQSVQQPHLDA